MFTLLATVEACMNSRPLEAFNDDPDDLRFITPHFVLGRSMMSLPEESTLKLNSQDMLRWRMLNQLRVNFGIDGDDVIFTNFKLDNNSQTSRRGQ